MLKGIISLILITLLFCNSNSQSFNGFEVVGPLSSTAITCLLTDPITPTFFLIPRIYKISAPRGIDQGGVTTFSNIPPGFPLRFTYVQVCRSDPPETITNAINQQYPGALPFSLIFVKVLTNTVPGCTWTGYTHQQNCDYLTALTNSLYTTFNNEFRATIQIHSTATSWKSLLGNTCKNIQQTLSGVWYANYGKNGKVNTDLNGNDFIPFGGWTKGALKTVSNSVRVNLCAHPGWYALGNWVTFV